MRLGMMQPYFFPYLGYFGLIAVTDRWVVFDTAQYRRCSWVNRNRVLSSGDNGWKYLRVPVRKAIQNTPISDIRISDPASFRDSILRNLDEYERRDAPCFSETVQLIFDCLNTSDDRLSSLLVRTLQLTCDHLRLPFSPSLFSELHLSFPNAGPGDWALETAVALGASEYVNPPGGVALFDSAMFDRHGVRLLFLRHELPAYSQNQACFLAGLSIIDVLMWNGRRKTRRMIDACHIMTPAELAAWNEGSDVRRSA